MGWHGDTPATALAAFAPICPMAKDTLCLSLGSLLTCVYSLEKCLLRFWATKKNPGVSVLTVEL